MVRKNVVGCGKRLFYIGCGKSIVSEKRSNTDHDPRTVRGHVLNGATTGIHYNDVQTARLDHCDILRKEGLHIQSTSPEKEEKMTAVTLPIQCMEAFNNLYIATYSDA